MQLLIKTPHKNLFALDITGKQKAHLSTILKHSFKPFMVKKKKKETNNPQMLISVTKFSKNFNYYVCIIAFYYSLTD